MRKKNKVPVTMVLNPDTKKASQKSAKKLGVSFSVLTDAALVRVTNEHAFIKECAELQGLTPEEAEEKFLREWGLL